jgi:hypothetical protein
MYANQEEFMALSKRSFFVVLALVSMLVACICLAGCGKNNAATWAHGEVTEEEVTTTINNMRTYYSVTDDTAWAKFVEERTYDSNSASNQQSATEKAITNAGGTTSQTSQDQTKGTAQDMRTYVIEQLVRNDIIQYQIKEMNVTVDDEEVDAYVEQQRAYVESQFMPGVFESVLQRQGYANLDAYKKEIREQLKIYKLEEEVASTTAADGTTSIDETTWNAWLDDQYANADVKINDAPGPLEYDIVQSSDEETSSSSSTATESTSSAATQGESSE